MTFRAKSRYVGKHRGPHHATTPVEPDTVGKHRGPAACDTNGCRTPGYVIAECTYLVEGEPRTLGGFAICPAHLRQEQDTAAESGVRQPRIIEILDVHAGSARVDGAA